MVRLRAQPPTTLAGQPVTVVDLAPGSRRTAADRRVLITGESVKVVVRPSGTEPKLKCYLEAQLGPLRPGRRSRRRRAAPTRGSCRRDPARRCPRRWAHDNGHAIGAPDVASRAAPTGWNAPMSRRPRCALTGNGTIPLLLDSESPTV